MRPSAAGPEPYEWAPVRRAGALVFAGTHTPHDLRTGEIVQDGTQIDVASYDTERARVLFTEVVAGRLRAQTWQVLLNLRASLESAGSSIEHVLHLRVFLADIASEGTVLDLCSRFFGNHLCSGEVVQATNEGSDPGILVHMDCVACTVEAGLPQHRWVRGFEPLSAPFPTISTGAGFLYSSAIPGAVRGSATACNDSRQLTERGTALLGALGTRASRRSLPFFTQQAAMWDGLLTILSEQGLDARACLYHMAWMRQPMSVFADGSVTRQIMGLTGDYLLTCFPTAEVRTAEAEIEGRIVALLPDAGFSKETCVPIHGISNSYFGALRAGPYVFAAGEVPVDTASWSLITRTTQLDAARNRRAFGKPYCEAPIQPQAHYIYSLHEATLAAYGLALSNVVHQGIYLTDAGDGPALEGVIRERLASPAPAATIVPILGASPFERTRLELEITAYAGDGATQRDAPSRS